MFELHVFPFELDDDDDFLRHFEHAKQTDAKSIELIELFYGASVIALHVHSASSKQHRQTLPDEHSANALRSRLYLFIQSLILTKQRAAVLLIPYGDGKRRSTY